MKDDYFLKIALKEALIAFNKNEVPVGAVIVKDGKILAKAHNKKEEQNDVLSHAEILAIKKASKKIGDWRLKDCVMYVTLKPCSMCLSVINQSRISKVFYILEDNFLKKNDYFQNLIKINNFFLEKKVKLIVRDFFVNCRKKVI